MLKPRQPSAAWCEAAGSAISPSGVHVRSASRKGVKLEMVEFDVGAERRELEDDRLQPGGAALGYDAMKTSRGPVASCLMAASVDAEVIGSSGNSSSAMASAYAAWSAGVVAPGILGCGADHRVVVQRRKDQLVASSLTWYAAQ